MIRVVLAVVLTTALLGVSLPAIDEARQDHTETVVRTELQRVERTAERLVNTDDPAEDGARRVVTLHLPARSWSGVGVDSVALAGERNGSAGRVTWTVAGGTRHVRHVTDFTLRTDDGPLTLGSAGSHRLVFTLDGTDTDPVVTVRQFTSDEATSAAHATVAIDANGGTGG